MEVIEQLGIDPTQGDASQFTGESAVIDVSRSPEIPTGWHFTKLHHPGCTPKVIRLLGAVMVGNIVLVEGRSHAIQERHGMRDGVVVKQLDHAAGCD